MTGLDRFIEAQARDWETALAELVAGTKHSHWMWYIFPQIAGLGHSQTARFFAIADRAEASAYLAHPLLGSRLEQATRAMLGWAGRRDAREILGGIDAMKFASSMTLFEAAGGGALFGNALDAFNGGARDQRTLALLG